MAIVKDAQPTVEEVYAQSLVVSLNIYDFADATEVDVWFEYSIASEEEDQDGEMVQVLSEPIATTSRETFTNAPDPDAPDDFIHVRHTLQIHPGTSDQELQPDTKYFIQGWIEAR